MDSCCWPGRPLQRHRTLKQILCYLSIFFVIYPSVIGRIAAESTLCFPKEFSFGVSTAAFQIEGAWNVSGKGESIWDRFTHEHPDRIFDHTNADIATDSYHLFKEDVRLIKDLRAHLYRFSISWPRILPTGLANEVNADGIRYYSELIDELEHHRIMPVVTMYHWDLPQPLQELGGWTNPIIIDYFVDYARILFDKFGDRVLIWLTFNEPVSFCQEGYGGEDAPTGLSGIEDYMCGHNVLLAHARVYRMYQEEYRKIQRGLVGITLDLSWKEPNSTSQQDHDAAERVRQFLFGWFANPIFSKEGDYPPIMRETIDENSKLQNFPRSRLPTFTTQEVNMIRGSYDFLGLNHYTTSLVTPSTKDLNMTPSFYADMAANLWQKSDWPKTNSTWLRIVPWGLRKTLKWIKDTYANPDVLITENGVAFEAGLKDEKRVQYLDGYLRSILDAIIIDKCNVNGYIYWSLMDNYEWRRGYSERFGLYEVGYTSPRRTRRPRLSAAYFKNLATTGCIPDSRDYYTT